MQDRVSQTFAALADPTRRAMLDRLASGEASVSELAAPFLKTMSLPAVTKHLKVLERAKLIKRRRRGKQLFIALSPPALKNASEYLERYKKLWEDRFDRLENLLKNTNA